MDLFSCLGSGFFGGSVIRSAVGDFGQGFLAGSGGTGSGGFGCSVGFGLLLFALSAFFYQIFFLATATDRAGTCAGGSTTAGASATASTPSSRRMNVRFLRTST